MTFSKRLFAGLTILVVLMTSMISQANAETNINNLQDLTYEYYMVQVAPEYTEPEEYPEDTPNVLFAHLGRLQNQGAQSFNGEITIPLPQEMNNFSITTLGDYRQGESAQVEAISDYKIDEANHTLTWKPNYAVGTNEVYNYVLEFFYNPIKKEAEGKKSFTVVINPQVAVKKMEILIESPAGASDFKVDLDGSTATLSTLGTMSNMYTYEDLKGTDVKTYPVTYVKADDKTSREKINDGEWNIPEDDMHSFNSDTATEGGGTATEKEPLISTIGAVIIAISILLAAGLIIVSIIYKGKKDPTAQPEKVTAQAKKEGKTGATSDAKKKLRAQLINGEIDQETYDREINKLS